MQVVHEIVAHAAHAAALTDLIERVGSYAGFAAIVGLAVLAALYFSQARDVRRLREWAGRAPERAAELQHGGRTAQAAAVRTGQPPAGNVGPAQPVAHPGTAQPGAQPGTAGAQHAGAARPATVAPAGQGAPARPATAPATAGAKPGVGARPSAAPASASAGSAAAAASAAGAAPATASAGGATTGARPGGAPGAATGETSAPARPATAAPGQRPGVPAQGTHAARATTAPGTRPAAGATTAPARGNTGTGAKVLPARPVQPQRPRPIPVAGRSGQTAVIPPPRKERRWTAPRYLALIVAGVIVLGLGGTVGVLALTGNDGSSKSKSPSTVPLPKGDQKVSKKPRKPTAPPIDPATVTVAVLNGTQVTGLAGTTGQKVSEAGFKLGNVATASQAAPRAESVVLYRPGASRQARAVARKLGISQIEPVDSASAALAGTATVVVVVGADRATTG